MRSLLAVPTLIHGRARLGLLVRAPVAGVLAVPALPVRVAAAGLPGSTDEGRSVTTLSAGGANGFCPEDALRVGSHPTAWLAGDWNGDGVPDLAVADAGPPEGRP